MSREEEEILADRLGKLAWRSGRRIGGLSSASGGRLGARLVARLLPADVHEIGLIPQRPGRKAAERVTACLRASGQP